MPPLATTAGAGSTTGGDGGGALRVDARGWAGLGSFVSLRMTIKEIPARDRRNDEKEDGFPIENVWAKAKNLCRG